MNINKNPWQKLSGREVYDNDWIKVEEHDVINPGGGNGIYGVVHFKNNALGIIPIDSKKNTWLVGQYRYTLDEFSWEIPMGGGDIQTDILESAKRELKEETGISAKKWTNLLRIHTSNSATDEEGYVFLAEDLVVGESELEESESDLQLMKLPFEEVVEMVMKGEITDALSIAGILKADRILKSRKT